MVNMGQRIKHECGIALLRLRKPLQYYIDKYKTKSYGVNKMFLLMHKHQSLSLTFVSFENTSHPFI